jgi:hypothetical protein
MDILTEKGAETLQQVADAIDIWRENFPAIQYIHTPDNRPADFDGILVYNGSVAGIVEIKCRVSMTFEKFGTDYKSESLVTFDKVRRCMQAADAIQAPFVGFLYFPHEKILLYKRIYLPDICVTNAYTGLRPVWSLCIDRFIWSLLDNSLHASQSQICF